VLAFDAILCLLLVGVAGSAVLARDLFAAIMLFLVFGLFLAIAWVRLDAVNVALAEAAIGAGLTGVLLLRTAARLAGGRPTDRPARAVWRRLGPATACAAILAALVFLVVAAPGDAEGLRQEVAANLAGSGLGNPVTAVLLDFRGYDTLLETIVLLAALLGVWSLTPDPLWGGAPGLPEHAREDGVLAAFGRLLPPVGLLVGVHLFWAGADAPGGAFQAGTVLAAVWMLAIMAGIAEAPATSSLRLRLALVAGPAIFLGIAAAAVPDGTFLAYPPGYAKLLILTIEAGLTFSLAATLALLVMGPPRRRA
jgi:multisubunit Na+/H+ antiporter MnhB subunit